MLMPTTLAIDLQPKDAIAPPSDMRFVQLDHITS